MTDNDNWREEVLKEIKKDLYGDETLKKYSCHIENGVAVIEYTVTKIIPLFKAKGEREC